MGFIYVVLINRENLKIMAILDVVEHEFTLIHVFRDEFSLNYGLNKFMLRMYSIVQK